MIKLFKIISLLLLSTVAYSQVAENCYRLYLTDKNYNTYDLNNPEEFLTTKSINRRLKQNISLQINDLPVSQFYLDSLKKLGLTILNKSKWLNTVVVYTNDIELIDTIDYYGFIRTFQKSTKTLDSNSFKDILVRNEMTLTKTKGDNYDYGFGSTQISMVNGHTLHRSGFRGENISIAIIDAGFYNVDILPAFDSLRINNQILGTKDFVDGDTQVFDASNHGMKVLSVMASNIPGELIGTAPKANYWLLRSEETSSEYSIEEDNWLAAAEFADSVGVDIINSSLGYTEFDDPLQNYIYENLDGNTTFITKAADIAASKGILVVNSAGNLGDDPWKYISAPADADSILTVGAVDSFAASVYFSGIGPTSDGRIKPDVTAMGYRAAVQGNDGNITFSNGTSFSAPIISGMAACLWQYFPNLSNMEIIHKIQESAHQYSNPDYQMGYGIPDFGKAAGLENINLISVINNEAFIKTYPNPFTDNITIEFLIKISEQINIELYNSTGEKMRTEFAYPNTYKTTIIIKDLAQYSSGIYYLKIKIGDSYITKTICKIN